MTDSIAIGSFQIQLATYPGDVEASGVNVGKVENTSIEGVE
jgi:hypothetical protein